MKKEELEAILSNGGEPIDTGPIDAHLEALATDRALPDLAIAMCATRIEEAAPTLRAALTKAANGAILTEDEKTLVFRGIHILGSTRDTESFEPLLRLLRRSSDEIDDLLGDAITENLSRIATGVFDGDEETLFAVIADPSIDEFIREALFGAATFLTWEGRIDRDRMHQFLVTFHANRAAPDDDIAWNGWLEAIALLGYEDLVPVARQAFDDGIVSEESVEWDVFEEDLAAARAAPNDPERLQEANLGYIDDVIEALEWTRWLGEIDAEEPYDPSTPDLFGAVDEPVINPWRHVGRNDPCPCGSGKKAKKCCLAS